MVKKQTWVQIKKTILTPGERAENIPDDSKSVPLYMWVKGYITTDGKIGDIVTITTITGRTEEGELIAVNPAYTHNYGNFIGELQEISKDVRRRVFNE